MWYVLQVKTGQESAVQNELQKMNILAIVPKEKALVRKGGAWSSKETVLFPSYVFLNLDYNADNYYKVKGIAPVIRFLGPSGLAPSQLTSLEAEWIKILGGINGNPLEPTKVRKEPDGTVRIVDGVLANFATRIIKYDKHSRKAEVGISICGEPKTIHLSVEIVDSV